MLIYSMLLVMAVMAAGIASSVNKYISLKRVIKEYPPYGECEVKMVWKRSVSLDSNTKGSFTAGKRSIEIAMNNKIANVMETYLHERRHSEQAFGDDVELTNMYLGSVGCLKYMRSIECIDTDTLWDAYYESDHEVDARGWASTTIKEYIR